MKLFNIPHSLSRHRMMQKRAILNITVLSHFNIEAYMCTASRWIAEMLTILFVLCMHTSISSSERVSGSIKTKSLVCCAVYAPFLRILGTRWRCESRCHSWHRSAALRTTLWAMWRRHQYVLVTGYFRLEYLNM